MCITTQLLFQCFGLRLHSNVFLVRCLDCVLLGRGGLNFLLALILVFLWRRWFSRVEVEGVWLAEEGVRRVGVFLWHFDGHLVTGLVLVLDHGTSRCHFSMRIGGCLDGCQRFLLRRRLAD